MATDGYRARQDILHEHMEHIQDLGKDNEALTGLLRAAESEISRLNLKVARLEGLLDQLTEGPDAIPGGVPASRRPFFSQQAS